MRFTEVSGWRTVMFTFGDECKPPVGFSGETISPKRIGAKWKTAFNQTEFTVRYREKGDARAAWFEEETFLNDIKINGLKPDTEYEMQVSAGCGTLTSEYTPLITTRTELDRNDEFACGATPDVFGLENTAILPSLRKGDYIYVNDFDIRIDSIGGGNGVYSGTGIAEMPFLSLVKVRVRFSGITINTDYRMIDGQVFSVYNPNSRSMVDLDKEDDITEGETDSDATSDGTTSDEFNGTEVVVDADIDSVYVNDAGSIAVQMADGTTQTIIPETNEDGTPADTRITDSNGDSWIVDSEGKVSGGSGTSGDGNASDDSTPDLTGLDSLIYKAIIQRIEYSQTFIDSLKEEMKPFIKEIEDIVETENFYPPRIRGANDELMGEGISLYIGIINKSEEIKSRLSQSVLTIDEARNNLIELDIPLQELKITIELLNELKEGDLFEEFIVSIRSDNTLPENTTDRIQYIEELLDQRISGNEE
jgi:hypothetical protein